MTRAQNSIAGAATGTVKGYGVGLALSIALTALPFGLVMSGGLPREATVLGIFAAAVLQILVHLHYFLHLLVPGDHSFSQPWNLMTFLFTVLIMVIFVGGSLWIMYNLHYRMM